MKILHYSLGFPPYRTGGLTKFCMDLMRQQVKEGHEVTLLWPGEIQLIRKRTSIRKHQSIDGIGNYEVINPVPVPFDEGIQDFHAFVVAGDEQAYEDLIAEIKPDVIHVHTLMGIHKSFLDVTKRKRIKLVFTAHDFFPICPKVTLFRHGQICDCIESCDECGVCNNTALSFRKLQILQSPMYRRIKDSVIIRKLRKQHRNEYLGEEIETSTVSVGSSEDYKSLRKHNYALLSMMDVIHYNSSVTKEVYERVFQRQDNVVIPITHSDIGDHRKIHFYDHSLRIRYMGPRAKGKGFNILNEAVERIWMEGREIILDVHFPMENKPKYIKCHERFNTSELEEIFNETDVLVCPSIWYETFGYTVLEALSYGIPVIVSNTVGAKDIVAKGGGIVIDSINADKLYSAIKGLNADILKLMNRIIVDRQSITTIDVMNREILEKVYT